jgi:hypothetical protein
MRIRATIEFVVPQKENPNTKYDGSAEELYQTWEHPNAVKAAAMIRKCLEDEHGGICEYKSVTVTDVIIL